MLRDVDVEQFIHEGFVRIDNAFSKDSARAARAILWKDTGCDPDDPSTWTRPVVRLGDYSAPPFREAANTPALRNAFDQLVGKGRWLPRYSLGSFPVRFPSAEDPGDAGWHVDASFPGNDTADYMSWRINVRSRGRALLMLFLFSDVTELDAPTRIRAGSHLDVSAILEKAGEEGLSFMELAKELDATSRRPQVLATGEEGTVYLCHPFIAHAAQPHRGSNPRFMAQPPLMPAKEFQMHREDDDYSPVEKAILMGIGRRNGSTAG